MSKVVYIDVDDTLVRSFGSKRVPIVHTIELVRKLKAAGATLYCWSGAGAAYAKTTVEELGIADCFVAALSKPQIMIDDLSLDKWVLAEVHPNECHSLSVEELFDK